MNKIWKKNGLWNFWKVVFFSFNPVNEAMRDAYYNDWLFNLDRKWSLLHANTLTNKNNFKKSTKRIIRTGSFNESRRWWRTRHFAGIGNTSLYNVFIARCWRHCYNRFLFQLQIYFFIFQSHIHKLAQYSFIIMSEFEILSSAKITRYTLKLSKTI